MDDLVTRLRAALDTHETVAKAAADGDSGAWFVGDKWNVYRAEDTAPRGDAEENQLVVYGTVQVQAAHIAVHDPAFVLADIAAKRKLVDLYAEVVQWDTDEPEFAYGRAVGLGIAVRAIAEAYGITEDEESSNG
jgi:hypothetical protein